MNTEDLDAMIAKEQIKRIHDQVKEHGISYMNADMTFRVNVIEDEGKVMDRYKAYRATLGHPIHFEDYTIHQLVLGTLAQVDPIQHPDEFISVLIVNMKRDPWRNTILALLQDQL